MSLTAEQTRQLQNKAKHWNARIQEVTTDAALALVAFDRARAAARLAQRGGDARAMHDLAMLLMQWAEQQETAHIRRHAS
ncbi:hypothetical protein [Microtetraspora malaysiensis]|uniref:hypothetical protein n=1 Tax=Microtetraspora malaysiensis TaxID=161358 RepID=UPI003D8C260F